MLTPRLLLICRRCTAATKKFYIKKIYAILDVTNNRLEMDDNLTRICTNTLICTVIQFV